MKKILVIFFFGLFLSNYSHAKVISIENKVKINVPESFNYQKMDTLAEYYQDFFGSLGDSANFYYIGNKNSINFVNSLLTDQEEMLKPIMQKIESKNFKSEKSMSNFISREFKKLIKNYKYDGVIWVYLPSDNLENIDQDLFEIITSVKSMNKQDLKKETIKYKKIIKNELGLNDVSGLQMKISKFKIEVNSINEPAFDLKLAAKMFNINWDMEVYGFMNGNEPIIVGSECIGKCKNISNIKDKINFTKNLVVNSKLDVNSNNIVDKLNKLNDLYKSGVLTKEEFEKAKKKILN
jgi:hypothetical protein